MKTKLFGTTTGLFASELVLGAANLGGRRGYGASAEDITRILAAYADAGGNVIDVADQYQLGEAEENVGSFLRGQRDQFIICSKYTRTDEADPAKTILGNHRKAMRHGVEGSLKRLKTDYLDVYMPHYDDGVTPLEEIARGLEDLVKAGKVLYPGLANFPAWKVSAISSILPIAALQIEYNLHQRTAERELIPMAKHFGMGTMLYSPLAGGLLTGKYREGESGRLRRTESAIYTEDTRTKAILDTLETIGSDVNATSGQVALAWTLTGNAFPIVGARTTGHLLESLGALDISLSADQVNQLNSVSAVTLGYPHDLLQSVQNS